MTFEQLEHVLRAAGAITGEVEMIVVGSQAVLAACPHAAGILSASMEADLYPPAAPAKADLIDGSIGEGSPFHETFGYYAHGVGPETARLPRNWRTRRRVIETASTGGVRALCPAPADLAASKLLAGRGKDVAFVGAMIRTGLVKVQEILGVCSELTAADAESVRSQLGRLDGGGG
jgi:hypothetical protein